MSYDAPRWPRVAMTVLGVGATVAATMCVIKAGGAAIASDLTGHSEAHRTVVATAGPATPHAAPQAVTVTADPSAEVPSRVKTNAAGGVAPQDLREVVYTISGNQRPNDPVTVVYADETGTLQTLRNVNLPWTITVVPVVPVNYVTANSNGSQLNCWITDAGGTTVAKETSFAPSTTCNR
ncbi:MAG: MmpS family transport accessory protein [Mycobacterium sp.]